MWGAVVGLNNGLSSPYYNMQIRGVMMTYHHVQIEGVAKVGGFGGYCTCMLLVVCCVFLWCSCGVLGSTAGAPMIAKAFLPTYPVDSLHSYNSTDLYHLILHVIQRDFP